MRTQQEHATKEENNSLQIKIYELNNQIDSLRRELGVAIQGREEWQIQEKTYKL